MTTCMVSSTFHKGGRWMRWDHPCQPLLTACIILPPFQKASLFRFHINVGELADGPASWSPTHPSIFLISSSQLGSSQPIQDRWTATAAAAEMPPLHAGSPPTRLATRGATTPAADGSADPAAPPSPCAPPCCPLVVRRGPGQTVAGRRAYLVRCPASKWLLSRPCRAPANVNSHREHDGIDRI